MAVMVQDTVAVVYDIHGDIVYLVSKMMVIWCVVLCCVVCWTERVLG